MADAEIQILVSAVDDASQTLKKIENSVVTSGKNIQRTQENTKNAFTQTQGALLQLGQAAQNVHNIMETYQRRTIMVENATDRLENATQRLKNAQDDVSNSLKKLGDIEKSHSRDSLKLEDAQIRVWEAWKNLNDTIFNYGKESVETKRATLELKEAQLDLEDAQNLGLQKEKELIEATKEITDKQNNLNIAQNAVDVSTRKLNQALDNQKWMYLDIGVQVISLVGQLPNLIKLFGELGGMSTATTGSLNTLVGAIGIGGFGATIGVVAGLAGLYLVMDKINTDVMNKHEKELDVVKDKYTEWGKEVDLTRAKLETLWYIEKERSKGQTKVESLNIPSNLPKVNTLPTTSTGKPITFVDPLAGKKVTGGIKNDFISRPGQAPVSFSSDDTIVGMKDIRKLNGGISITITGNIYGTDPDEISDAIMSKLRSKISL